MENSISRSDVFLRQIFKYLNRFMIFYFRLGLGRWGNRPETSQIMVLVHTGRKSGLPRRTPVNFVDVDGDIYCTAAFGASAHWYRNILTDPKVEIWLPDGWYAGVAEDVSSDDPRWNDLMRQVLIASGFAAPLFAGMNPRTADDARLADVTADYKLIRIRPIEALTGPGGPGDLAWIWPLSTLALLAALLAGRRNRSISQE